MEYKIQDHKTTKTIENGCHSDISAFDRLGFEESLVVNFL
jgi:hypothetical protein